MTQETAGLIAVLKAVLQTWVNGRRVGDGIPLLLRRKVDRAIAKAEGRT